MKFLKWLNLIPLVMFVLVLAGVGTAVFAIRNRKEAVKNGDI